MAVLLLGRQTPGVDAGGHLLSTLSGLLQCTLCRVVTEDSLEGAISAKLSDSNG